MTAVDDDLPFLDEHCVTVEAPAEEVWQGLRRCVDRTLADSSGSLFTRVLGTQPSAGFAITSAEPECRLLLNGRHRFSCYALAFELDPSGQRTVLCARSYARFPGPHGRVYRGLVIGTRFHVVATRRLLRSIRRECER